ncbi:MAG TPA: leucyl aminopeptidase [Gemmatimonadota bacterium]|nr:leucyl aminopeptidase [Gemmatimonadota bacterium]
MSAPAGPGAAAEDGPARSVEARAGDVLDLDAEVVAVALRKGETPSGAAAELDRRAGGVLARWIDQGRFAGREKDLFFLPAAEGPDLLALGMGEMEAVDLEAVRRAAGRAVRAVRERRLGSLAFSLPAALGTPVDEAVQAAAEGLVLGDWSFEELRGEEKRRESPAPPSRTLVHVSGEAGEGSGAPEGTVEAARRGRLLAEAQNWARGLVARPGNVATPSFLATRARELASEFGLEVDVWGPEELRREGFGGLLAVARGSTEEPRFIILQHRGDGGEPFVLVGKGVTFDAGGISLKPAQGMEDMKYDMAGGAAVLGALRAAAALELPRRVVGLVPSTENLPSGSALKPADVIRGVSGKSIEVVNTDAEGRLILSDALAYAARLQPRAMVDLATLTGGCVVALGHHASGLMSDDDGLVAALEEAARRTGERVWRLPLWKEYRRQLDSDIADIKNSAGRDASPLTAGCFLKEFVDEDISWAHLDIAGTAWADEDGPYQPEGATGVGVRLLLDWLRRAAEG